MASWGSAAFEVFWRNALAAIPLALLVTGFCRLFPCRPSTRHALWAMVLLFLVAPPLLPGLPLPDPPTDGPVTGSAVAPAEPATVEGTDLPSGERAKPRGDRGDGPSRAVSRSTGYPPRPTASPCGVARTKPCPPAGASPRGEWLAPATGLAGLRPPNRARPSLPTDESTFAAETATPDTRSAPHDTTHMSVDSADPIPHRGGHIDRQAKRPAVAARMSEGPRGDSKKPAARNDAEHVESSAGGRAKEAIDRLRPWLAGLGAVRETVADLPPIPTDIWLSGMVLVIALQIMRILAFRRRVRSAFPASASVQRTVSEAARRIGLKRVPETLMVNRCVSPMIWCGRRTRLILPVDLWSQLDPPGREAIVCHELAHLRRGDHWLCCGELLVAVLYWWHPLLWWVRRRLHEEAELCCDAWVTWLMPHSRRAYAEALLRTKQYVSEQNCTVPAVGIGMITGRARRFTRRLTMVMTQSMKPRFSVSGIAVVLVMATVGWLASPAQSSAPTDESVKAGKDSTMVVVSQPCKDCKECKKYEKCKNCGECKKCKDCKECKECKKCKECKSDRMGTCKEYVSDRKGKDARSRALAVAGIPGAVYDPILALPLLGSGVSEDDDPEVEERLDRLEKRLDELMRKLEGRLDLRKPRLPKAPPVPDPVELFVAPPAWAGCETMVRAYKLPEGKLEALTALMVRSDVPILVSPKKDRIEVTATEAQHGVFKAFVDMVNASKDKEVRGYGLPEGKLDALTELMVRSDVPVLVEPGPDHIKVHGTNVEQAVFKAFVDMIHPSGEHGAANPAQEAMRMYEEALKARQGSCTGKSGKKEAEHSKTRKEYQKKAKRVKGERERAERELKRIRRELDRESRAVGAAQAHLQQAFQVLGEEEAHDLQQRLQALAQDGGVEALLENAAKLAGSVDMRTIEDNARVLDEAAALEAKAEALAKLAEMILDVVRGLEERLQESSDV